MANIENTRTTCDSCLRLPLSAPYFPDPEPDSSWCALCLAAATIVVFSNTATEAVCLVNMTFGVLTFLLTLASTRTTFSGQHSKLLSLTLSLLVCLFCCS